MPTLHTLVGVVLGVRAWQWGRVASPADRSNSNSELIHQAWNAAGVALAVFDAQGALRLCNAALQRALGTPATEDASLQSLFGVGAEETPLPVAVQLATGLRVLLTVAALPSGGWVASAMPEPQGAAAWQFLLARLGWDATGPGASPAAVEVLVTGGDFGPAPAAASADLRAAMLAAGTALAALAPAQRRLRIEATPSIGHELLVQISVPTALPAGVNLPPAVQVRRLPGALGATLALRIPLPQ